MGIGILKQTKQMSQKGFTLVELLVYMLMSAIVVTIAAQVWMSFTTSAKKTSDRMGANLEIEQVLYYLAEDISRVGIKSNTTASGMLTHSDIFMSVSDSSSFHHVQNGTADSLTFKAAVYSDESSIYLGYDSVSYFIDAKKLKQSLVFVDSSGSLGAAVVTTMVDSVTGFDLEFGVYSSDGEANQVLGSIDSVSLDDIRKVGFKSGTFVVANSTVDSMVDITSIDAIDSLMISIAERGTANNKEFDDNGSGLEIGKTYRLNFKTMVNQEFVDNFDMTQDTMAVLLRGFGSDWANTAGVPIYYFYPGEPNMVIEREFSFTPSEAAAAPAFYLNIRNQSDLSTGVFRLGETSIIEESGFVYNWVDEFTGGAAEASRDRQNTRAISMTLTVKHDFAVDEYDRTYKLKKFIKLPNNGVR